MYKPKESTRCQPRVAIPIRLDDQCLSAAFLLLSKAAEKVASARNIRDKKCIREFIYKNIPVSLQQRIFAKAVDNLAGAHTTLQLLELFKPEDMAKECVDLLGAFRLGFGCYIKDRRLTWSQGSAKKFNLMLPQLDQLYTILRWADPSKLTTLCISVARDAIKQSKLPNVLAQAHSLTKLTILSGVENHTLRIIGLNCPCLQTLDVSHSIRVTDEGLRCLFIKSRTRRGKISAVEARLGAEGYLEQEKNACALTLCSIILIGTSVSWEGCNLACKLMKYGFYTASLPFVKIIRVNQQMMSCRGIPFERQIVGSTECPRLTDESKDVIFTAAHSTLLSSQLRNAILDVYYVDSEDISNTDRDTSYVFIRDTIDNFKIHLHFKLESTNVTALVLPWYTFTWKLESMVDLDTLGFHFPNLKSLKGRVKGRWTRWGEPLLPCLESAYVWSLNSTTVLSVLQNVPFLKYLEFNNTETLRVPASQLDLSDSTLESSLTYNETLAKSLEYFTIRPSKLTRNALSALISKCPNLKRIGDLESWNIQSSEIMEFNSYLDSIRSQCVLTIMNFPPEQHCKYQWTF